MHTARICRTLNGAKEKAWPHPTLSYCSFSSSFLFFFFSRGKSRFPPYIRRAAAQLGGFSSGRAWTEHGGDRADLPFCPHSLNSLFWCRDAAELLNGALDTGHCWEVNGAVVAYLHVPPRITFSHIRAAFAFWLNSLSHAPGLPSVFNLYLLFRPSFFLIQECVPWILVSFFASPCSCELLSCLSPRPP